MNELLIISAYFLNVFLNRFLNKITYKQDNYVGIVPIIWFIPIFPILAFLIIIFINTDFSTKDTWFTGKYWKKTSK